MKKLDVIKALEWSNIYDDFGFEHLRVSERFAVAYAFYKVRERLGLPNTKTIGAQIIEDEINDKKSQKNDKTK